MAKNLNSAQKIQMAFKHILTNICIISFIMRRLFLHIRLVTHHVGECGRSTHYHIFSVVVKIDFTSVGSILATSAKNMNARIL